MSGILGHDAYRRLSGGLWLPRWFEAVRMGFSCCGSAAPLCYCCDELHYISFSVPAAPSKPPGYDWPGPVTWSGLGNCFGGYWYAPYRSWNFQIDCGDGSVYLSIEYAYTTYAIYVSSPVGLNAEGKVRCSAFGGTMAGFWTNPTWAPASVGLA